MAFQTCDQSEDKGSSAESSSGSSSPEHGYEPHQELTDSLPIVDVVTNEEDEEELTMLHADLYRYNLIDHEWKERGTGYIKILKNLTNKKVRIVMRRDKTYKVCANHFITTEMVMKPLQGSEQAFFWHTFGEYADEEARYEILAVKFQDPIYADIWINTFLEAQKNLLHTESPASYISDEELNWIR